MTKVGNKNERFAAWIKFLIFTPETCLLVTAEMEDYFFWSSWLFITSSSCFKTINRQEALLPTLIISHKDKFEVQIELLWAIKRKVSMVWKKIYQSSACKFIYTIIFSQYVLFKCAQQNYTMATWQISFLVLAKCVCHIR